MSRFIEDGYTRRFTVKAMGQTVNGFYRPPTSSERKWIRYRMRWLSLDSARDCACEWISQRIVEWDLDGCGAYTPDKYSIVQIAVDNEESFNQLFLMVSGCIADAHGTAWNKEEHRLMKNLYEGVILELSNPYLARRDCAMCKTYWYDEKTGLPIIKNDGTKMLRVGVTLCETQEGCKKGTPENQKSLCKENRWAYEYHRHCDSTGIWPNDAIVKRNAEIIRKAIDNHERHKKTG